VETLVGYWRNIFDKYGRVMITVAGGEPLTYPNFAEVFEKLSLIHDIEITTNLSIDKHELQSFVEEISERNVKISGTFHPNFADLKTFTEKAMILKKHNMLGNVIYLAWPPQIKDISFYSEEFKKQGLSFCVFTFWGKYNEKEYPEDYTEEEKKIIGMSLGKREGENFQVSPIKTKGKLCNAGCTYAVVLPDGEVLRCGGGGVKGENISIGNFFDENFKLQDKPTPCHSEVCPCNEWAFLLTDKD
jgi:organic radical activating enzyme